MFARFDENPAMTFQDIKETKHYGWTQERTDGQRENSIPTTKFAGGGGGGYYYSYMTTARIYCHIVPEQNPYRLTSAQCNHMFTSN